MKVSNLSLCPIRANALGLENKTAAVDWTHVCVCVHVVIDHVCMSCHWLFSFVLFMSCSCFVLSLTCRCDTLFLTCWVFHLLWHGSDNSGLMSSSSSSTSSEATRVADYTEKKVVARVCACRFVFEISCLCMSVFKGCCACHECFWEGFRFSMTSSSLHFDKRTLSSWFWWWLSLTILINFKMLP